MKLFRFVARSYFKCMKLHIAGRNKKTYIYIYIDQTTSIAAWSEVQVQLNAGIIFIILCLPPDGVLAARAIRTKCWLVISLRDDVSNSQWNIKLKLLKLLKSPHLPQEKFYFLTEPGVLGCSVLTEEVDNESGVENLSLGLLLVHSPQSSHIKACIETGLMQGLMPSLPISLKYELSDRE